MTTAINVPCVIIEYFGEPVAIYGRLIDNDKVEIISAWFELTGNSLTDEQRMSLAVFRAKEIVKKMRGVV